jgi:hypothetical protein
MIEGEAIFAIVFRWLVCANERAEEAWKASARWTRDHGGFLAARIYSTYWHTSNRLLLTDASCRHSA